jgi:hypothetical protein
MDPRIETQVLLPVLKLRKDLEADRTGQVGGKVDIAAEKRGAGALNAGKKQRNVVPRQPVHEDVLGDIVDRRDQAADRLLGVKNPAAQVEFIVLGVADETRALEHAVERRDG